MKKITYIIIVMSIICLTLIGCVSSEELESLQDEIDDIEDELDDAEDENDELNEEKENLVEAVANAEEYTVFLKSEIERVYAKSENSFKVTFEEYYPQLVFMSVYADLDILSAPEIMQMDTGNITYAFVIYTNADDGCEQIELYIETDPYTEKINDITIVIVQDEELRGMGDSYLQAYETLTNLAAAALFCAEQSPYYFYESYYEYIQKIRQNDSSTCFAFNIDYVIYEDDECEARSYVPQK